MNREEGTFVRAAKAVAGFDEGAKTGQVHFQLQDGFIGGGAKPDDEAPMAMASSKNKK